MSGYKKLTMIIAVVLILFIIQGMQRSCSKNTVSFSFSTIDNDISRIMKDWHIPGLAIAIVKDSELAYMKGYGVLDHNGSRAVDEDTIFAIGSCTKMFTASALGLLVDDGVLDWKDKASLRLPSLRLSNKCMQKELNIIDMLSHRSGLEEVGMLWDHSQLSRSELINRMQFLTSIEGFREGWVYNNLMYLAAGQIIPSVTGISWDDFIAQRIFTPLGMTRSTTSIKQLDQETNKAVPHYVVEGVVRTARSHNIDGIAPAGGINSSIKDMSKWLRMLVNEGAYDGKTFIRKETLAMLHSPFALVTREYPPHMYGLGLGIMTYHNHEVIFHEGNIDGMSASLALLPDQKVGIVILTNVHRGIAGKVILNTFFDKYLGVENAPDWNLKNQKMERNRITEFYQKEQEKMTNRAKITQSFDMHDCIGMYHSDLYGDMAIMQQGNDLACEFLAYSGIMKHSNGNIFTFDPSTINPLLPSLFYLTFLHGENGVEKVHVTYEDIWMNDLSVDFVKK